MAFNKELDGWKRAKIIRPHDCIISSEYTNKSFGFKPSYEKYNEENNMFHILGYEYARRWDRELGNYYKELARSDAAVFILRKCRRVLRKSEKIPPEALSKKKRTFKNLKSKYMDWRKK